MSEALEKSFCIEGLRDYLRGHSGWNSSTSTNIKRWISVEDAIRLLRDRDADRKREIAVLEKRVADLEKIVARMETVESAMKETLACHPSDPLGDLARAEAHFDRVSKRARDSDE
jgi:hypothetical protein